MESVTLEAVAIDWMQGGTKLVMFGLTLWGGRGMIGAKGFVSIDLETSLQDCLPLTSLYRVDRNVSDLTYKG